MAARNNAATESDERVLVITRIFDAPRHLVFKAWTEPKHLVHWWGPKDFTLPTCTMDFRLGGAYRFCLRSPEGTDHWLQGVYREIMEPERLVITYAWEDAAGNPGHETLVTVTFAEHAGKTKLTMQQAVFESVTTYQDHESGWTTCLDRLTTYLAKA
ncbi:MAG: SRPBCC domain-containing protein [Deltaproteobacteria bacterium]|nr:SRPBCC domain-containing protein [Deltaproteobacteria bacterium]